MELQYFLLFMAMCGLHITTSEWDQLVETANGSKIKIVGRIFVLNLPIVLLIYWFLGGELSIT